MADLEEVHWWYRSTRTLLGEVLAPYLPEGGCFLDAGCGTGSTGAWMDGRGRVVACDLSALALGLYGERHPGANGRVAADVTRLPFASGSFDAVLAVTLLYHRAVASPAAAVGELMRVAKPGAVVCLLEPGVRRLSRAHDRVTHAARRFALGDLRALLVDNGMRIERATGAYSFLVPPAAIKSVLERGETASDLDRHQDGFAGALGLVARAERAVLRHVDLPFGLSVLAVGRVPRH
jgi:SAM-dependent methyltransferase